MVSCLRLEYTGRVMNNLHVKFGRDDIKVVTDIASITFISIINLVLVDL